MKHNGKSSLFLMEIMIALLIFSVCACACAAIIAKASSEITESRDISNAMILAQNRAELIKSGNEASDLTEYYDQELSAADRENAVYSSVTEITPADNGVYEYTVEIYRVSDGELIYSIESAYFSLQ